MLSSTDVLGRISDSVNHKINLPLIIINNLHPFIKKQSSAVTQTVTKAKEKRTGSDRPSNIKGCTHCGAQYTNKVTPYTNILHTENRHHWNRRAAKAQDHSLRPIAENKMLQWEVIGKRG